MNNVLDFLPPMIMGLAFLYVIAAVVTGVLESRRRAMAIRARSELLNRVLDKFGSSRDFIELSESSGGKRLLEALGSEPNGASGKILSAVQRGVVMAVLGVGLLLLSLTLTDNAVEELFRIFGVVSLALGVGYLASAAVSYRMARSMGLLAARGAKPLPEAEGLA